MSRWLPEIRRRLAPAKLDPAREAEIAQELEQPLDDRYRELRAEGCDESEAIRGALAEIEEDERMRCELTTSQPREVPPVLIGDPPGRSVWRDIGQDVRYACRMLCRNPVFAALAIATLAIGVGATTAVYAIVDNVLLRAVPYKDIDRLVRVYTTDVNEPGRRIMLSFPDLGDLRQRATTLEAVGTYRSGRSAFVLLEGPPQRASSASASASFFESAGVRPILGRSFAEGDTKPGAPRVSILSHAAWRQRFGGDPAIVGRTLKTTDGPVQIIGVLEAAPMFAQSVEFWLPITQAPWQEMRGARGSWVMARLRDGVSIAQAQAEIDAIGASLALEHPETNADHGLMLESMQESTVGYLREPLYVFLAAVGCILLIACLNVAGLLTARGAARAKEIALRTSLGAVRSRVVRQLLTESVVLALVGGAVGIVLAWWTIDAVIPLFPLTLPAERIAVDWRVVAIVIAAAGVAGALSGIAPALSLSRDAPSPSLKDVGQAASRAGRRIGSGVVALEIGLSLILLGCAGLMFRTLVNVYAIDPGLDVDETIVVQTTPLLPADAPPSRALTFYRAAAERVAGMPGIQSASAITSAPLTGSVDFGMLMAAPNVQPVGVSTRSVLPAYFSTMGIRLIAGRDFTSADTEGASLVAIVNEKAAAQLWPGRHPIGQRFYYSNDKQASRGVYEVIGVVGDVRHVALDREVYAEIYHSLPQRPSAEVTIVARSTNPTEAASRVAGYLTDLPAPVLSSRVQTYSTLLAGTTRERRHRATLLAVVAALGVLLSAVGVFGVTSYTVNQRTREIGVRIALGATTRRVIQTVLGGLIPPVTIGLLFGGLGSFWATQIIKDSLLGVAPTDALTFSAVTLILIVVTAIASYLPARRALRVDPVNALRAE